MKNAHERFGFAEFEKKLRDTTTRIRLTADCFIGERAGNGPSVGHLLSAFGTDVEVAALWAAILGEESIRVGGQNLKPYMVQFGERPAVYRGTLTVPGRRRPVRHLVVVSTQLRAEGDQARIIVKSNSSDLTLRAVANLHGLPLLIRLERVVLCPPPKSWPYSAFVRPELCPCGDPGHKERVS
jgi:hypothetical protein